MLEFATALNKLTGGRLMQGFRDVSNSQKNENSNSTGDVIMTILYLIFMVVAGWLSWSKNSMYGYDMWLKVVFAVSAGLFGGVGYILFYYITSADIVGKMEKLVKCTSGASNLKEVVKITCRS